ncbi:MAG: UpxY family transcription antiterminator [Bacteroidales bacterium]|nr:UpxY family transcription antiterminator [Bacteroidales bacterium]
MPAPMQDALQKKWYALKVFFNKAFDVEAYLDNIGIDTYMPVQKVLLKGEAYLMARKRLAKAQGGTDSRYIVAEPLIYQRRQLVNSLLFVHCSDEQLACVEAYLKERDVNGNMRGYIYRNAQKEYAAVPDKQMASFRLVVEDGSEGLEFFAHDDISRYATGDHVRVKEGPLRGAEGYIRRIRRDRRLLVVIEGVIAVATTYIPPQNLEKI